MNFCPPIFTLPRKESGKRSLAKRDEKSDRSIRKSDQKGTERVPKTKKVIEVLLPTSFCGTLRRRGAKKTNLGVGFL